jgi:hypothetical protein
VFTKALKSKAIDDTFTTRYRFVTIPPGDLYVRLSLLTKTMVKLFGNEAKSEFIGALKSEVIKDGFMTWYRFVTIPPCDSWEKLRREKRALAT